MAKKKPIEIPEDGDSSQVWLGSFADIMSLLLGFFMILYSLSHMDEKKFYDMGKSIAASFKAIETEDSDDIPEEIKDSDRQIRAFQMLVAVLNLGENNQQAMERVEGMYSAKVESETVAEMSKEALNDQLDEIEKLKARVSASGDEEADVQNMELILPDNILFAPGTAILKPEAKSTMRLIAANLSEMKDFVQIKVVGHTDSRPPGRGSPFPSNWHLSTARANAVLLELMAGGLPGDILSASGRAHFSPLVPEFDKRGKPILKNMARNRRVQIILEKEKVGS